MTIIGVITSSVIIKAIKSSFTRKKDSASVSCLRATSSALLRRSTIASHSSSTSRADLNVPVVFKT